MPDITNRLDVKHPKNVQAWKKLDEEMNKEQLFLEIDEIYSEWHGGDLHIGKERTERIKEILNKAINYSRCCKSDSEQLADRLFEITKEFLTPKRNEK